MSRFDNLTIRSKIAVASMLTLLMTASLGAFSLQRLSLVNAGAVQVTDNWLLATRALGDLGTATMHYRQVEGSIGLSPTPALAEEEKEHLEKDIVPQVQRALALYEPTISTDSERTLFDDVNERWSAYLATTDDYLALVRSDRKAAALLYIGAMKKRFADFQASLKKLVDFQINGARVETSSIKQTYSAAWDWILAGIALAVVFSVGSGFSIVKGVSTPIRNMTDAMGRLARHDFSTEIVGVGREDEVGQMASAVQVFKDSMIESDRLKAEQEVTQKRTAERAANMDSLTRDFEDNVANIVQAVAAQAGQMETSAQSMSATAEETTKQASAVASSSEESSANVQSVASATEELSSSIQEIGRQVGHSSRIATNAVSEAERANAKVQSLVSASQKIGEVVALINDIADQTNLLALNATIEAARAGEAGKGFAVVAAEVKNLAAQTSKATEDIGAQIDSVQGATRDAVKAIDSIGKTISEIHQIATAIAAAVEQQGAATREIARSVEEAAKGTQEVSSNIGGVTEAADGTGKAAGKVLTAARTLTGQSVHLRDVVQRFLAGVKAA